MAIELEAKLQVNNHQVLRDRLKELRAKCQGEQLEINIYFDTTEGELLKGDRALRLRCVGEAMVLTYKGPPEHSKYKQRQEIQTSVADAEAVQSLLGELGFAQSLVFEKRRQSWLLDECRVELDSLPLLGDFVEVEGPSEAAIGQVLAKLGLEEADLIATPYPILLRAQLERTGNVSREIRFVQPKASGAS